MRKVINEKIRSIKSIIEPLSKENQKEILSVVASISGVPMWVDDVVSFIKKKKLFNLRFSQQQAKREKFRKMNPMRRKRKTM